MRRGTALGLVGLGAGTWLLARVERLRTAPVVAGELDLTVVIPARDEAASLPRLLSSLGAQVAPAARIVVVDDESTDGTAAVARAHDVEVVAVPPRPPGWTGKAWACWTGAALVTTERIAFVDADTWLAPAALVCWRLLAARRLRPAPRSIGIVVIACQWWRAVLVRCHSSPPLALVCSTWAEVTAR